MLITKLIPLIKYILMLCGAVILFRYGKMVLMDGKPFSEVQRKIFVGIGCCASGLVWLAIAYYSGRGGEDDEYDDYGYGYGY